LNRAIQKYVEDPLAEEILKGDVQEGDTIVVDYSGEGEILSFGRTNKEESIENNQ